MDIDHFIERERNERESAASTECETTRAEHLELAERYRAVVEAMSRAGAPAARRSRRLRPPAPASAGPPGRSVLS